jgi:hypothetical protein
MSPSTDQRENRAFASELKFLVEPATAEEIRTWARNRLAPDPNAEADLNDAYQITSLYFDTEQFDVFHRKGSFGRSKYRIRRYGESDRAFLERKLKTRGLVSKRRSIVSISELDRLAQARPDRTWAGYWYQQRLEARRLKPVCEITYRRTARVSMTHTGPIRLTLDEQIRAQTTNHFVYNGVNEGIRLSEDRVILELKYRMDMPAEFKVLLEQFRLMSQPMSKYRLAAVALGLVKEPAADPIVTAVPVPLAAATPKS